MADFHKYSYHRIGSRLHPQTMGAIIILCVMLIILFILHFILAPKYVYNQKDSSASSDSNSTSNSQHRDLKIANIIPIAYNPVYQKCDSLIRGLDQLTHGIDITNYNLFPEKNLFEPIFEYSCDMGQTWSVPAESLPESNNETHFLPDQIREIKYLPGDIFQIKTILYQDISEFKKELLHRFKLSDENSIGSFAASDIYRDAKKLMLSENKSIFEIFSYNSTLKIYFHPATQNRTRLNRKFVDFINQKLTSNYTENPSVYNEFLNTFGTHYFEAVLLGRSWFQRTSIQNDYRHRENLSDIKSRMVQLFIDKVKFGEGDFEEEENQTQTFGESDAFQQNTEFITLGHHIPWIYAGQLSPIERLIPSETVRAEVKRAVYVRRLSAELEDLRNTIELTEAELSHHEWKLLEHIEKYLNVSDNFQEVDLDVLEAKMESVANKVDELRDTRLLETYYSKLKNMSDDVVLCKWSLIRACHANQINYDFEQQNKLDDQLRDEYLKLLNQRQKRDRKGIINLIQRTVDHIEYHQHTPVDICENYTTDSEKTKCWLCVRNNVDCWHSKDLACKTDNSWKIIGYKPARKVNCACKTMMIIPQIKPINEN